MKDFLEVTHDSQHGKSSFNHHALVPGAFLTDLKMARRTISIAETQVSQDNGLLREGRGEAVEVLVGMVQGQEIPFNDAPVGVQHYPETSANHPAPFITTFLAKLSLAATLANGKQHLHRITVHHAKETGLHQKQI